MLPVDEFIRFSELNQLYTRGSSILLAVSGGKDSVLMAHLFNAAQIPFGIAHCNFKLRETEADADETFVKSLAVKFNVPFFTTQFETSAYASKNGLSIQMAARELRYTWFEQLREQQSFERIALAHHKSDTAETILLNLIRGTGIAGLHGILPQRGNLIRPLLYLTREEIDRMVDEANIEYREDGSNASNKYVRNKLRLEVMPRLKEINPQLEETFEQNSKRFIELEGFLNQQVEQLRKKLFLNEPGGNIQIDLQELKTLEPQDLLLFELFKPFGFSSSVLHDLVHSWHGQAGKIFESATHRLLLDRRHLFLSVKESISPDERLITATDGCVDFGNYTIRFRESPAPKVKGGPDTASFDYQQLQFPLKFRCWKEGDFFHPFGMNGKKKLSDFFISLKLPLTEKHKVPILQNGNGDIIWVAGYRTDQRYKITAKTQKVIIFDKQNTHEH